MSRFDYFPTYLNPRSLSEFENWKFMDDCKLFRGVIYDHILKKQFEEYIDVKEFCEKREMASESKLRMMHIIKEELVNLGWEVENKFENTVIFIYPKGNKPVNLTE